ncbi:MAG: segregation/condensation protein A [Patescibacteria group bacterium]
MTYQVKLEQFEGPLDLLLQLIEKEDLDINQISLAKIADEYIQYVNSQSNVSLDDLSDFLLIASKLIYIKSKALLPYLVWGEEEEEAIGLEGQLKIYKEFLEASKKVEELAKQKKYFFARERVAVAPGFYPPEKISAGILKEIYAAILNRIEPLIAAGKEIKERVISIKQKIEDLKVEIGKRAKMGFRDFVGKSKNKTEVIVSFLALLELIKQKIVEVSQENLFSDIEINKK